MEIQAEVFSVRNANEHIADTRFKNSLNVLWFKNILSEYTEL